MIETKYEQETIENIFVIRSIVTHFEYQKKVKKIKTNFYLDYNNTQEIKICDTSKLFEQILGKEIPIFILKKKGNY